MGLNSLLNSSLQNLTISFIGDSLGLQQFQSMLCLIDSNPENPKEVENIGSEYGFHIPPGRRSPTGWAYRFTKYNITLVYGMTVTLSEIEALESSEFQNISGKIVPLPKAAVHLDRVDPVLEHLVERSNVVILNTGHHWNRSTIMIFVL